MYCPFCKYFDTKVIDSRLVDEGNQVRRRRECLQCQERFTTYETAELLIPHIIKRDGRRQAFDAEKLRNGLNRALEKRPISIEETDIIVSRIIRNLHATGEREVKAQLIGEWVMEELRKIDEVAYVRFASVYRRFQDIQAFREEISRMENEPTAITETEK